MPLFFPALGVTKIAGLFLSGIECCHLLFPEEVFGVCFFLDVRV